MNAFESTPRNGIFDPDNACIDGAIAPDCVALAVPFFETAGGAALLAAALVVLYEFFGFRILSVAVIREHCYRYRPAVSIEPLGNMTNCDALDVLLSAAYGFKGITRAGVAMSGMDVYHHCGCEGYDDPDTAAHGLISGVLCPRDSIVKSIATRLLDMKPLDRDALFKLLGEDHDLTGNHDLAAALIDAMNRDRPCEWPMSTPDTGVIPACGDPLAVRFSDGGAQ